MGRRRAPAVTESSRGSWAVAGVLAFVLGTGCGGGESSPHVSAPPPSADFTIGISPSAVTVNQGTTNSAIQISVQPANGFSGAVQVTLSGLPAGVTTNPQSPFEVQSGAGAMLLVGAASSAATGTATISAQGTSGALTHTASLKLTVQSGTLPAVSRTTFVRTDSIAALDDPAAEPHHRHMAYDAANRRLFVANAAANRVEVLSTVDGSHVAAIDAAGASSADLSADGKTVWVGTITGQILGIDTNTLRPARISLVSALTPVPNTVFDRPEEVVALSSGQALVRLRQGESTESLLAWWDPVGNSLTDLTAAAPQLFQNGAGVMERSGDHTRVFVAANDSSGTAAVFSGNGTLSAGPKTLGAGIIQYAAGNQDGSKFAVVLGKAGQQVLLLDSALNVVASRPTSSAHGLVFSRDSDSLYLAELQDGNGVITALAATDLHQLGQVADLNLQSVFTEIEEADETALVFGMGNRGTAFLDAAQPGSLQFPLPAMSAAPAVLPGGGGNAGGVVTTLSGTSFGSNAAVLFGGQAAASDVSGGATQIAATAPASAFSGAVNVSAYFANGVAMAPDGFSYGPQILEVLPNTGNASGGDAVAIYGYGFGEDASQITVKFGSANAATQKVEDLAAIAPTLGLAASYPFPLQRVTVTAPAGSEGAVDLTLSAPSGSMREQRGFHYLQSSQVFAKPGFYKFVAYDRKRQWIYLSNIDHVDVFDLRAGNYRPGILPPGGPPPNALIREAALTPDAAQLAIADFGAQSVYLMNPDTAAGSKVFVGGVAGDSNSGPVRIAATSSQNLFIGLAGFTGGASACSTCLQQMNLANSPVSVEAAPQPEVSLLTSSPLLDASADGATAYFSFASAPGQPVAGWSASTPLQFATAQTGAAASDFAVPADGNALASRIENIVEVRDQSFGLRAVTRWSERQGIPQRTLVPGIAVHPSGALVYVPFLTGPAPVSAPFTGLQGGVDIMDAHTGRLRLRVMLPEPLAMLAADVDALQGKFLTIDENGQRLFALTASGLSVVQLDSVPLGIGTLNPPTGPVSGGITVTVRGSGFQTGASVSVGGIAATTAFVDRNTLQFTLPAITTGMQRLTVCNPHAECVSLDGAFTAN